MSGRRRIAFGLMLGIIFKHFLSTEYGPIDRAVELGVFILIAYEVAASVIGHRRERKHKERLKAILDRIQLFMAQGTELQQDVPLPQFTDGDDVDLWRIGTQRWAEDVSEYLATQSGRAHAAFNLVTSSSVDTMVVHTLKRDTFSISGDVRYKYTRLIKQIDNLRSISEKPEVYFESLK